MNNQELTRNEKPKELEYAEQLIHENKFVEATQILIELGKNEKVPLYHRVLGLFLQCRIFMWQGKYNDCYKIAEQAYKESLGLEKNLKIVEALSMMALAKIILREFNKGIELLQQAENLLKTFPQEETSEYFLLKALIAQNKGYYNVWSYQNLDDGLKYLKESLSWRKRYGGKVEIAMGFVGVGSVLSGFKGELDRAIEYLKQGLPFANESGNKWPLIMILKTLGDSYFSKGELDCAIEYYKSGLKVAKEINNNTLIINFLIGIVEFYREKGELEMALNFLSQSMAICEEFGNKSEMVSLLSSAIELYLIKDEYELAEQYLKRLKQLCAQLNDKFFDLIGLFYESLLLKSSGSFRNKMKAQELLREILDEENLSYSFEVNALIYLIDLLLTELRITNEEEIMQEIEPRIIRLLEVAEISNSYWVLCETYLLQAKLALLKLDIKKARRLLIQAAQIAKRYDLKQLIKKINIENEELLEKLGLWEKLKEINAPLVERLNLVRLNPQIASMVQISTILTAKVTEEKVAIQKEKKVCLVCRADVLKFSYICECGAIYCDSCARALTNLENVCWACNTPIDYSKPIKPFKEGEFIKSNKGKKGK